MRHLYLLYLASDRERRQSPGRCCTDEPRSIDMAKTSALGRRARKLARAIPASASTFRHILRNPLYVTDVAPGEAVVSASGKKVGRVHDVYVSRRLRQPAVAVTPIDPGTDIWLFPAGAVRRGREGVIVLDDTARLVA